MLSDQKIERILIAKVEQAYKQLGFDTKEDLIPKPNKSVSVRTFDFLLIKYGVALSK